MSLYWKCQLAGWSGMAAWSVLTQFVWGEPSWMGVAAAVGYSGLGMGATHLLKATGKPREWVALSFSRLVPRILLASVGMSAALQAVVIPLLDPGFPDGIHPIVFLVAQVGQGGFVFLGWLLLYLGYHMHKRGMEAEEAEWRLRLAMQENELSTLRAQLNPHFLFNSLNSLRALIPEDPARAQEAVTTLARLLRHTLHLSRSRTVTLEREMEAAESYLALEKIRFDERLTFRFRVPDELKERDVPPMLLQTLVENAVKHGIARRPAGGRVDVEASSRGTDLILRVTNPGTLPATGASQGIGLANANEQLQLLFGAGAGLDLLQEGVGDDARVVCRVCLPNDRRGGPTPEGGPSVTSGASLPPDVGAMDPAGTGGAT